jgi:spectinomycin phosphotransferase
MTLPFLLHAAIEDYYDITISRADPGPAGHPATARYVLTDHRGARFFCKHVTDSVMAARLRRGLPLAVALADYGLSFVVAPLAGARHVYMKHETGIVALYPYVDAPVTRHYDPALMGAALAAVHAATPFLDQQVLAPPESPSPYGAFFERGIFEFLATPFQDETPQGRLRNLLHRHEGRLRRYVDAFMSLASSPPAHPVATHGRAHGNALQKDGGPLYLAGWDAAEIAAPERDLWFLAEQPGFMAAYTAVRPGFTPDPRRMAHADLSAWLEGLAVGARHVIGTRQPSKDILDHLATRRFAPARLARLDAAARDLIGD